MKPARLSKSPLKPLLLACDTSQAACSVALARGDEILAKALEASLEQRARPAEALMPMIEHVMQAGGVDFAAIDGLAVTYGPGTFTGVRVGLAAMRGLALALNAPLLGLGTLSVMAAQVKEMSQMDTSYPASDMPILVAIDARRDTYYCQLFDAQALPKAMLLNGQDDMPQALSLAEVHKLLPAKELLVVGTGAAVLCAADKRFCASDAAVWPQADVLVRLAAREPLANWPSTPPEPLYLRPPDAKLPPASKRLKRQADMAGDDER